MLLCSNLISLGNYLKESCYIAEFDYDFVYVLIYIYWLAAYCCFNKYSYYN